MRRRCLIQFLLLPLFATQSLYAGLERYSQLVVADPNKKTSGIRITYLGTNGYQFEFGGHSLLIDPYFSRIGMSAMILPISIRPNTQRLQSALKHVASKADAIVVTHGHVDHLFDASLLMQKNDARLIASHTAIELAVAAGAPSIRCDAVTAGDVRQIEPWKIYALVATHDRVFPIGVPFSGNRKRNGAPKRASDWICGEPLAFLIEAGGKRIYIDSGGRPSLLPPANIGPVDLAIVGVALPDSRARFIEVMRRLRPRYILPSHQDNFFQPLDRGFVFGPMTDFPRVLREYRQAQLPGRLILLDYFRPWTLR
jgi:L-ascorbate metabolism protein UlaG (beta-lactamase superfamily)